MGDVVQAGMRRNLVGVVVIVGALLAGCGAGGEAGSATHRPSPPVPGASQFSPPEQDPVALIGSWRLAGVDGEADTVLRIAMLDGDDLALWRRCGRPFGSWRANTDGLFVGYLNGVAQCPSPSGETTPAWLRSVTAFRVDGDNRVLLDAGGGTVARLLPGGRPIPLPTAEVDPSLARPPVVTDRVRRQLAPAAPLPRDLAAVARDALVGRWVIPADQKTRPRQPFVELRADGGWVGSDGCNFESGRWVAGPAGALLATTGPSTAMYCDGVSVGYWLFRTHRAGMDGDVLVLLDRDGAELGRLRRG